LFEAVDDDRIATFGIDVAVVPAETIGRVFFPGDATGLVTDEASAGLEVALPADLAAPRGGLGGLKPARRWLGGPRSGSWVDVGCSRSSRGHVRAVRRSARLVIVGAQGRDSDRCIIGRGPAAIDLGPSAVEHGRPALVVFIAECQGAVATPRYAQRVRAMS